MKKTLFILFVFCLSLTACASGNHEPFKDDTPEKRKLTTLYHQLNQSIERSEKLSVRVIGTVTYGAFESPILCIFYRNTDLPKVRTKLLINAGVHGNEPAGVGYVLKLIGQLSQGATPLKSYDIDIIPVVNPWGWSHDIRFDKDGFDINRDFASFESQEAKIIRDFLRDKHYDLVMDLHEDPEASGVYFYQYASDDKRVLPQLADKMRSAGYPIEEDISFILLKTHNGIIDAPMWGLWYVKLTGQLSISNYCRLNVSEKVFTIETPTLLPMEKRIFAHQIATRFLQEAAGID